MNYVITVIIGFILVLGFNYERERKTKEVVENIQKTANDNFLKIQKEQEKQNIIEKRESWEKAKTKIHVRAKDTKTCMRILNTDVINNEVIECNKDHDVELRNDEVEKFKKDNEL